MCDYLAYCLDDPETDAIILFVEGFKRPERFLALADQALALGKPILAVKVGRSAQAQAAAVAHSGSMAGEARATDAALAAAGVVRCADLDALFEAAELHAGCRRLGRGVGRGRTGVVTVSTGEASLIADLRRDGRGEPAGGARGGPRGDPAGLPTLGYIGNPIDPWGATDERVAYPTSCSMRLPRRAPTTCSPSSTTSRIARCPARSAVAIGVAEDLIAATATRPGVLPVYVSLTSGEPTPEIVALLDAAGGIPVLRGTTEALGAIAGRASWEGRRAARLADGPRRPGWPALAAGRIPLGHDPGYDPGVTGDPSPAIPGHALPERESLRLLAGAGLSVVDRHARPGCRRGRPGRRRDRLPGRPQARRDRPRPQDGRWRRTPGPRRRGRGRVAAAELLMKGRAAAIDLRGLLVEPMLAGAVELIVGLKRDPQFGLLVLVGLGGVLAEALR